MLTDSAFSLRMRPAPAQLEHGFSITRPAPWQLGQVRSMVKKPCWARTLPWPWQVGQLTGLEPGAAPAPSQDSQICEAATCTLALVPPNASSRLVRGLKAR